VRALHIGINSAQRNVQVQIKCQDDASEQSNECRKCCILKIRELYFHTPELGSPSNVGVVRTTARWRRLPANGLPVENMKDPKVR